MSYYLHWRLGFSHW